MEHKAKKMPPNKFLEKETFSLTTGGFGSISDASPAPQINRSVRRRSSMSTIPYSSHNSLTHKDSKTRLDCDDHMESSSTSFGKHQQLTFQRRGSIRSETSSMDSKNVLRRTSSMCGRQSNIPQAQQNKSDINDWSNVKPTPAKNPSLITLNRFLPQRNSNEARKVRRCKQIAAIANELVDAVWKVYTTETSVLVQPLGFDPVMEFGHDNFVPNQVNKNNKNNAYCASDQEFKFQNLNTSLKDSIRNFIQSLPPRYLLGIESPEEVLVHMRLVARARRDPTDGAVHVTSLDENEYAQSPTTMPSFSNDNYPQNPQPNDCITHHNYQMTFRPVHSNLKMVTICCIDCAGMIEFLTGILGAGGSEILDFDFVLTSSRIMLIRCVVNLKGRLRLERLDSYMQVFLKASYGLTCDTTCCVSDLPLPERFGAADPNFIELHGLNRNDIITNINHDNDSNTDHEENLDSLEESGPIHHDNNINNNFMLNRNAVFDESDASSRKPDVVPLSSPTIQPDINANDTEQAIPLMDFLGVRSAQVIPPPFPSITSNPDILEGNGIVAESLHESNSTCSSSFPSNLNNNKSPSNRRMLGFARRDASLNLEERSSRQNIEFEEDVSKLMVTEIIRSGVRGIHIFRGFYSNPSTTDHSDPDNFPNYTPHQSLALKVAISKSYFGDDDVFEELEQEAVVAKKLNHINVCKMIKMHKTPDIVCLAYEFCVKGTLDSLLKNEDKIYDYLPLALDIAQGMAYLHSQHIIHRDLKPSNIFIDANNRAKIADFGMSITHTGEDLTGETGTYRWMAPEVIRHEPYSINSDIYSFGIILWQLVTRCITPYNSMSPIQAAFAVAKGQRPDIPLFVPHFIRQIITACWDDDQLRRPSFANVCMGLTDYRNKSIQLTTSAVLAQP